jgi:hypothetical protein
LLAICYVCTELLIKEAMQDLITLLYTTGYISVNK